MSAINRLSPIGRELVQSICDRAGVSVEAVMSRSRDKDIVHLRHDCWHWLRIANVSNKTIAEAFGVTHAAVSRVYTARGGDPSLSVMAMISTDHMEALKLAAADRGISTQHLISNLLNVIAQDDIFNAVLDDGVAL